LCKELAVGDGRGAAGAEADLAVGSTAAWLRGRLRMGASAASVVRTTRVISPAPQRTALAVRDRGCVVPDCPRPLARCDGQHLASRLDGGPTDLPTSPCSVGRIIGPCMRAAGDSPELPTAAAPPSHPIDAIPATARRQPTPVCPASGSGATHRHPRCSPDTSGALPACPAQPADPLLAHPQPGPSGWRTSGPADPPAAQPP
jgi:hypothetical protein